MATRRRSSTTSKPAGAAGPTTARTCARTAAPAVDDDPASLDLAARVVGHAGHEVVTAADGTAGLAVALETRPPLILLDLHLPGMDLWEFVSAIRASAWSQEIHVVAVSASATQTDRLRALAVGCNEFLAKPYALEALRDVVARQARVEFN